MGDLSNFYRGFYEREKQNRNDNLANVLNLSSQIYAYRSLLSNLLIDMEEENPNISIEFRKERVKVRMAELENEFNEIFKN
ncbi:MAG: hypothetical protein ACOVNU_11710 [Candidatus Kapaibacteriota bacterium]